MFYYLNHLYSTLLNDLNENRETGWKSKYLDMQHTHTDLDILEILYKSISNTWKLPLCYHLLQFKALNIIILEHKKKLLELTIFKINFCCPTRKFKSTTNNHGAP